MSVGVSGIPMLDTSTGSLVYVCVGISGIAMLNTSTGSLVYVSMEV